MTRIDDYSFKGLPQELIDWKDQLNDAWNFGKYQPMVSSSTPAFVPKKGEFFWQVSGTTCTLYMAHGTSWNPAFTFVVDPG